MSHTMSTANAQHAKPRAVRLLCTCPNAVPAAAALGTAMITTTMAMNVFRSNGEINGRRYNHHQQRFTPAWQAVTGTDEETWMAAVSLNSTSTASNLRTDNSNNNNTTATVKRDYHRSPSPSVNCTLSDRAATEMECRSNPAVEQQFVNLENVNACAARRPSGVMGDEARQMNCIKGGNHVGRSEKQCHEQQQQYYYPCDMMSGSFSNHGTYGGLLHGVRTSPFRKTFVGNPPQHHGGGCRQQPSSCHQSHHNYYYHQHQHQQHHNCVRHYGGAARRSHRRHRFGVAAVEAIRSRMCAGTTSPRVSTISPSFKGHKHQGRVSHTNEQGSHPPTTNTTNTSLHVGFQVPLPRSKLSVNGGQEFATPIDGDVRTMFIASGSEFGGTVGVASAAAADNTSTAFRLASIAPFFDCAIQQFIIECERRVPNTFDAATNGTPCHESSDMLQKQQQMSCAASMRSFDIQSSAPSGSFPVSPFRRSQMQHALLSTTATTRGCEAEYSTRKRHEMEEPICLLNPVDCPLLGERYHDKERNSGDFLASGDFFTLLPEGIPEQETAPTMVQHLIESIGLHFAYADAAPMVLIAALVYMSRITNLQSSSENFGVTTANWYCLIAIAILIATKMYVDGSQRWNERIANATGLSLKEVKKLELDFLFLIDFTLLIKEEEVEAWTEWMESVARRRGMSTQLRAFIFGRSSYPPSIASTPMSSFAGDDILPRSLSRIPSGNLLSTPLSPTSAHMTPQTNAHISPRAMKPLGVSQRLSLSSALDISEKNPKTSLRLHMSMSPPQACEPPSPFSPSPMHATLASQKSERLFSIVHAPQEPTTPRNLQQLSMSMSLTPPDQQCISPVEFFKKSLRVDWNGNDITLSEKSKQNAQITNAGTAGRNGGVDYLDFENLDYARTPPHPPLNILSPPEGLNITLPPPFPASHNTHFTSNNNSSNSGGRSNINTNNDSSGNKITPPSNEKKDTEQERPLPQSMLS